MCGHETPFPAFRSAVATEVRLPTVDKKMFLRKMHEDPSLAFRVMQKMSQRTREPNSELTKVSSESR